MARSSGMACMFCESEPCQCNKRPKVAPAVAPAAPTELVELPEQDSTPSAVEAMREAAARAKHEQRINNGIAEEDTGKTSEGRLSDEEYATLAAVRALAQEFTLAGPDFDRLKSRLERPADIAERAAAWRYRHKEGRREGDSTG